MVNFKPEFLNLLNRTEKVTIRRLNKLMLMERVNYQREQEQLKRNAEQTVSTFITYIRSGRKVALINNKPAIGETRTLKFKSYSTGLITYELPTDLQWELDVDMYAIIDPSTKAVVGMATRKVNTATAIEAFHTTGNATCFGTAFKAINQANVQKAYDKLTETLEVVNVDSLYATQDFLRPIERYATKQKDLQSLKEDAETRQREEIRCPACREYIPTSEFDTHYETHHQCAICKRRYLHEEHATECQTQCAQDKQNYEEYQKTARGANDEQQQ